MPSIMIYAHLVVSQLSAAVATVPTVTLNNGVEMPMMLLGTGEEHTNLNSTETEIRVRLAMQVGWTGVDTAHAYWNGFGVSRGLLEVERSSVFVSTKIGGEDFVDIAHAYNHSLAQAEENLKMLSFDYVDMVLIHEPPTLSGFFSPEDGCRYAQEQWRALEDFMKSGKARAIGVSNFCKPDLACILETATVVPAINQLLFHVGMGPDPRGLVTYNSERGIKTMAYEPLGSVDFVNIKRENSLITGNFTNGLGQPYGKSGAQVSLRWLIQHGVLLATGSGSEKHLQEDLDVFKFTLTDTDMQILDDATAPAGEPNHYWAGVPACEPLASTITV